MNRQSRTAIALLLGSLAAATALQAQAADIVVENYSSQAIYPYFRSNCWNPAVSTAHPREWVSFGGINMGSDMDVPTYRLRITDVPELTTVTPAGDSHRDRDDD
jgi:hypothetical protein